jgi:SAM-dependent methyltransferase
MLNNPMMTINDLIESWRAEERQPFIGWDFSYLDGRWIEEQAPWSYLTRAGELMDVSRSALDMDTGGGERLLRLRPRWPARMAACEAYPPNFKLASERLNPLGVEVKSVKLTRRDPMPYADGEFDLVLNRHSAFNSREVARILAPGGTFLTRQVDGHWAEDLEAVFGAKPQWPDATLTNSRRWLEDAGLQIVDAQDWRGHFSFTDVGAIVYYLRHVPWLVPGFSVETHLNGLLALQARLDSGEPLTFFAGYFLIEARKV